MAMTQQSGTNVLEIPGGEIIGTGGNCEAIRVQLPNNRYLLVTSAGDGHYPPAAGDPCVDVGIYMRDVREPLQLHEGMPTTELVARLPVWAAEPWNMITLEQFRRTRREVPDLSIEITDTDRDLAGQRGFVYAGGVYMTIMERKAGLQRVVSIVLNDSDVYLEEDQLPTLEEYLYDWAVISGALDNVSATDTGEG
jgi:hypothetical protein